jgi:hypothetical protein
MLSYLKQHLLLILSILLLSPLASGMIQDPRAIETDPSSATTAIAPRLKGLGEYGFDVTTSNVESQFCFNQGLRLYNEPGAASFTEKFTQAWQEADVELESSRF